MINPTAGRGDKTTVMTTRHIAKPEQQKHLFSGSMKMSELINENVQLLGVVRRMGIRFGFGEATVAEVCDTSKVSLSTLLLVSNIYTFEGYLPSLEELSKSSILDIVKYLHASHTYYMDYALTSLANELERLIAPCDDKHKKIIQKFFYVYKEEMRKHFEYEENTVFPYVLALKDGSTTDKDYSIEQYEDNHTNVEEKLNDLKNIVMKYLPKECDDNLISSVLGQLYSLEADLDKHTMIEENILIPMVNRLEE